MIVVVFIFSVLCLGCGLWVVFYLLFVVLMVRWLSVLGFLSSFICSGVYSLVVGWLVFWVIVERGIYRCKFRVENRYKSYLGKVVSFKGFGDFILCEWSYFRDFFIKLCEIMYYVVF